MNEEAGGYATTRRWLIFFAALLAVTIYVIFRYGELMLGAPGAAPVRRQSGGAERGAILDRNGRILAIEALFGNIGITPSKIKDKDLDALAINLAPLLEISEDTIRQRARNGTEFVYLKKKVDQATARSIEKLIAEKRLTGITVDFVRGRVYPEETLAAQIIGFTGDENRGLEGIEFAFDNELRAQIAPNGDNVPGNRVMLTIDANIQYILEEIAAKALAENNAEAVLLTAMDPRSGDILGSASLPGFNPNKFGEFDRKLWSFRPAVWSYEPGSVFKIFSVASLLDGGFVTPTTSFYCNGSYDHITNRGEHIVIKCLGAHGTVTARDVIIVSCNAGAGYASDRVSTDIFYDRIRLLGFGFKTASGAPGESAGFFRHPSRWSSRSKPTIAMGQEIAVSTMQMLKAATAIATDGTVRSPRLVSRIVTKDGVPLRDYIPADPVRVMKPEVARAMRSYMRDVTGFGTGRRAFIDDIPLAVKTGTAEIIDPVTGSYSKTDFIASCMAIFPENDPALVLYITIFKPKGESYLGGRVAAPYIKDTAEALVNYLGIPRGRNQQYTHSGEIIVPSPSIPSVGAVVPDFRTISKRQILPLLLRDDLNFVISGDGWVRRQSPPPGAPLTSNTIIHLEFE
ncbi:MAG: transpeptidase family protein [Spirochaetaceae bacterium]|jgi:cell division protein FtsI (penicillin-binding protein 3)|nr:transpeptidase family protein [Spirochaetaceae bacterium]